MSVEALRAPRPVLALLAAAAGLGLGLGILAVEGASFVHLDLRWSPALGLAAIAGLVVVAVMARHPGAGACILAAVTFSNASDVLVRGGLPSALQLFVPLMLVVLAATQGADLGRAAAPLDGVARAGRAAFLAGAVGYACVLAVSTTWAADPAQADDAAFELSKAVFLGVVFWLVVRRRGTLVACLWTLLLTGAALACLSTWKVLSGNWTQSFGGFSRVKWAQIAGERLGPRATGPLSDPNFYAQALLPLVALALALALSSRRPVVRAAAVALGAVVAAGIATTYSRGGALALAAELAVLLVLERRRIRLVHLAGAAGALALAVTFAPATFFAERLETLEVLLPGAGEQLEVHDSSVEKRKVLMAAALEMALDHPLLGVGAGNYSEHFEEYSDVVGARARIYQDPGQRAFPHSLLLEVLAETGLVGLLAFGTAVAGALVVALRAGALLAAANDDTGSLLARALAAGVMGLLVSSLILHGDYPRYLWMALGLCVATASLLRADA